MFQHRPRRAVQPPQVLDEFIVGEVIGRRVSIGQVWGVAARDEHVVRLDPSLPTKAAREVEADQSPHAVAEDGERLVEVKCECLD